LSWFSGALLGNVPPVTVVLSNGSVDYALGTHFGGQFHDVLLRSHLDCDFVQSSQCRFFGYLHLLMFYSIPHSIWARFRSIA
jgi:hypothetical protein